MAVWIVRGGTYGEREGDALEKGILTIGFGLVTDLSEIQAKDHVLQLLQQIDPEAKARSLASHASVLWAFKDTIRTGDLIVMPRKGQPTIAVGEMAGEYEYRPEFAETVHGRAVRWINSEVPRDSLAPDLRKAMNGQGTLYQPRSEHGEKRLRAVAETGRDPGPDDADDVGARWDAFIGWAKRFYEWEQFDEMEREYKLRAGERLATVKQALRDGSPDWEDLLRTTFRDPDSYLRDWRANEALLELDPPRMEKALRWIWGLNAPDSFAERVRGFQEFGPFGTPGAMASVLLMGDDPTRYPMYAHTPLKDAYRLTGYPSAPNDSPDAWGRYEHALGFWDEFIEQASFRSLHVRDRLDAQALVWCVTHYGRDDLPDGWLEDAKDALVAYREGTVTGAPPRPAPTPEDPWSPANVAALAEELLWEPEQLQEIIDDLQEKRQVIFYGPPGTGKTYVARAIARHCRESGGSFEIVQFHPSYSYEDFVEGFRPRLIGAQPGFELEPGPLRRIAGRARDNTEATFILVIDELNRGNVAKVFGELYFLLEYRNEEVRLQYGGDGEGFSLPSNLWFICTMNTADRSIALMDAALRRRFYFARFFPDQPPIRGLLRRWLARHGQDTWAADLVDAANGKLDRDVGIGPSYFMGAGRALDESRVRRIWQRAVIPYVEEQFFGDTAKLAEFDFDRLKGQLEGTGTVEARPDQARPVEETEPPQAVHEASDPS